MMIDLPTCTKDIYHPIKCGEQNGHPAHLRLPPALAAPRPTNYPAGVNLVNARECVCARVCAFIKNFVVLPQIGPFDIELAT